MSWQRGITMYPSIKELDKREKMINIQYEAILKDNIASMKALKKLDKEKKLIKTMKEVIEDDV